MREEDAHELEVHVSGIVFDNDLVLIVRRSDGRRLYPGKWECGGGSLKRGEDFEQGVVRQMKEELGVHVTPLKAVGVFCSLDGEKKIPGVRMLCQLDGYVNGQGPAISREHQDWRWVPYTDAGDFDMIPDLRDTILELGSELEKV